MRAYREGARAIDGGKGTKTPAPAGGDGGRTSLRDWRVRTRLITLVLIPTLAGVILGGLRIADSVAEAGEYERAGEIASLAILLGGLAHEVELERDLAVRFVAAGRAAEDLDRLRLHEQETVDRLRQRVNARLSEATADEGPRRLTGKIDQVRARLKQLDDIRLAVSGTQVSAEPVLYRYDALIGDLLAVHGEIAQGISADAEELTAGAAAFAALAQAKEHASTERAVLSVAIASGSFTTTLLDTFVTARAQRESALAAFDATATPAQRQAYDDTVTGQRVDRAEHMRLRALIAATGQAAPGMNPLNPRDLDRWFDASSDTIKRMRLVEIGLGGSIVSAADRSRAEESGNALVVTLVVGALLLVVLLITTLMARSLVGPLRRLRDAALEVAGRRLPETVNSLREGGEAPTPEDLLPGAVTRDEIGEVARAFDEVHREAVRLAGQEAALRNNVNAMFVNLSRRSQTLVERQLTMIESLEQGEQDETRLGNLFRLDHLATRMRRNSENLLVLAGQEPARRWSQPVPLIDVARAALSEVENYERANLRIPSGPAVLGSGVNDVVHLLAELLENAISFSPSETVVTVSTNRIDGGGLMISVSDFGIGMTGAELSQANWRLANPPVVDVSVSRRMGLFVVGRLALRHGIRVQLRQQENGGLTAMVLLPDALLAAPDEWSHASRAAHERQAALAGPSTPFDAPGPVSGPTGGPVSDPMFAGGHGGIPGGVPGGSVFTPQDGSGGRAESWEDPYGGPSGGWAVRVPRQGSYAAHDAYDGYDPAEATGPIERITGIHDRALDNAANGVGPPGPPEERLPVYSTVESDWFRAPDIPEHPDVPEGPADDASSPWISPADPGFRAADRVADGPTRGGVTGIGLPRRVPRANLVPGAVEGTGPPPPPSAPVARRPAVSPEVVRDRLSGLQQGVRQGRAEARGEPEDGRARPDLIRNVEASEEDS
ncbi:nitrate- and nitrite sensing domain-containing protein [Spongiactinospora sp. TRM90649]|uniref:sensor histidine kinase n=1 Tax=Spongiactinospora sp. TRM90649 TaxID=3031114 RepID=UPI0023F92287|nr:nitrate- and nitrite sensing domain-containing protein [Spongiactinospora sp. TRM90649]MDF5752695.1 nitrate- and nitrite sensing domain-containing protein [Spongiactinospora sp. TRM90649]